MPLPLRRVAAVWISSLGVLLLLLQRICVDLTRRADHAGVAIPCQAADVAFCSAEAQQRDPEQVWKRRKEGAPQGNSPCGGSTTDAPTPSSLASPSPLQRTAATFSEAGRTRTYDETTVASLETATGLQHSTQSEDDGANSFFITNSTAVSRQVPEYSRQHLAVVRTAGQPFPWTCVLQDVLLSPHLHYSLHLPFPVCDITGDASASPLSHSSSLFSPHSSPLFTSFFSSLSLTPSFLSALLASQVPPVPSFASYSYSQIGQLDAGLPPLYPGDLFPDSLLPRSSLIHASMVRFLRSAWSRVLSYVMSAAAGWFSFAESSLGFLPPSSGHAAVSNITGTISPSPSDNVLSSATPAPDYLSSTQVFTPSTSPVVSIINSLAPVSRHVDPIPLHRLNFPATGYISLSSPDIYTNSLPANGQSRDRLQPTDTLVPNLETTSPPLEKCRRQNLDSCSQSRPLDGHSCVEGSSSHDSAVQQEKHSRAHSSLDSKLTETSAYLRPAGTPAQQHSAPTRCYRRLSELLSPQTNPSLLLFITICPQGRTLSCLHDTAPSEPLSFSGGRSPPQPLHLSHSTTYGKPPPYERVGASTKQYEAQQPFEKASGLTQFFLHFGSNNRSTSQYSTSDALPPHSSPNPPVPPPYTSFFKPLHPSFQPSYSPQTEINDNMLWDYLLFSAAVLREEVDKTGWELLHHCKVCTVWKRPLRPGDEQFEYIVHGEFDDISVEAYNLTVSDLEFRKQWDSHMVDVQLLDQHNVYIDDKPANESSSLKKKTRSSAALSPSAGPFSHSHKRLTSYLQREDNAKLADRQYPKVSKAKSDETKCGERTDAGSQQIGETLDTTDKGAVVLLSVSRWKDWWKLWRQRPECSTPCEAASYTGPYSRKAICSATRSNHKDVCGGRSNQKDGQSTNFSAGLNTNSGRWFRGTRLNMWRDFVRAFWHRSRRRLRRIKLRFYTCCAHLFSYACLRLLAKCRRCRSQAKSATDFPTDRSDVRDTPRRSSYFIPPRLHASSRNDDDLSHSSWPTATSPATSGKNKSDRSAYPFRLVYEPSAIEEKIYWRFRIPVPLVQDRDFVYARRLACFTEQREKKNCTSSSARPFAAGKSADDVPRRDQHRNSAQPSLNKKTQGLSPASSFNSLDDSSYNSNHGHRCPPSPPLAGLISLQHATMHHRCPELSSCVRVRQYRSGLVLFTSNPKKSIYEKGLQFVLYHFDDPRSKLPARVRGYLAGHTLPSSIKALHETAALLHKKKSAS